MGTRSSHEDALRREQGETAGQVLPIAGRKGTSRSTHLRRERFHRLRLVAPPRPPVAPPTDGTDDLPFDQYQRYRLVADLVRRSARGRTLSVLDLGGRTGVLRRFLPEHRVFLVDVERSELEGLVLGDGSRLPFAAKAFDLVVACDTLEHVPQARRAALCAEAVRVARAGVILAGPYASGEVVEAEELLRRFLKAKLGLAHRYLDEHRDQGLPELEATEACLHALGARTALVGHGNLERWLALQCVSMYMDEDAHLRVIGTRVHRFYNRALYASDQQGPFYRHALFAALGSEPLPELEGLFEAPASLPFSLEPFAGLVAELCAFDRERDVYQKERERVTAVVEGLVRDLTLHKETRSVLEQDLEGHRSTLADARARLEEHRGSLATLSRDLEEHRRAKAVLEQDLAGHKDALVATRALLDEHRTALVAVEADLAGHRRVVAALQQDLDGHVRVTAEARREVERHVELVGTLTAELAEHRRHARALEAELALVRTQARALEQESRRIDALAVRVNAELVSSQADNAALRAEVARHAAEIERQRGELRSRWRSLKRAFGRKPG